MASGWADWTKPSGLTWTQIRNLNKTEGSYNFYYDEDSDKIIDRAHLPGFSEKIADFTLTEDVDHVDITGLDLESYGICHIYALINDVATVYGDMYVYINDDYVDADYQGQGFYVSGSTYGAGSGNNPWIGAVGAVSGTKSIAVYIQVALLPDGVVSVYNVTRYSTYDEIDWNNIRSLVTFSNVTGVRIYSTVIALGAGSRFIVFEG